MANCPSYDCGQDFPVYTVSGCTTKYKGGVNAAVILRCGIELSDPSDGTEINALIAAGNAAAVSNVSVTWDAPSAVTGPSYVGCVPDTMVTQDWSFEFVDRNVTQEASEFWSGIVRDFGGEIGGILFRDCGNDRAVYIDEAITIAGGPTMPGSTDFQRFVLTGTYQTLDFPEYAALPTGVWV